MEEHKIKECFCRLEYAETLSDQEALSIYREVLEYIAQQPNKDESLIAIAEKAYKGLTELSRSENEYIWEVSTQLLASYEHLIIEECAER